MSNFKLDLQAQGVRFKVLAHMFPALRHSVIVPLSNVGLAAALLHNPPADERIPQRRHLIGEMQSLLEDSVSSLRELDKWLIDLERQNDAHSVFEDCRRLVAYRLLASGKQVSLPQLPIVPDLRLFSSRYVILAWLLCLLDTVADGEELRVHAPSACIWTAEPGLLMASPAWPGQPEPILPDELSLLAAASGWQADCAPERWTLRGPLEHS
ncbi:hypothetical protein [Bordetella avium]|uniref:hypothetical protein n=1 Tax=Bordetella avium TaxID=521 RepID=UPI000E68C32E|nr:hypothetical protein [Bordetella avium]RIQ37259.1 hypothetical protein D0848_13760 [Bordetella avium]RIQ40476.1 hypothetical protein D0847_13205 [Bordetella avium]RIQ42060.1 hypothetical protein D0846_13615 [Bordetella avium]RIQ47869.1 hypothetical protein D0845_12455 [Bordetella avium]RIQ71744.1 hypothetical protein D0836_12950 [Bordetella avium]